MRENSKEDQKLELIRTAVEVLPEDHPLRQKLVEKLRRAATDSGKTADTSVRQWLELVSDISARDLVDLIAVIERIRAAGSQSNGTA